MIGIYFRVSTNKQETDSQRHVIDEWIRKKKYDSSAIKEYCDKASTGKNVSRPAFQSMMEDARRGTLEKIIAFDHTRMNRNIRDAVNVIGELSDLGVELEFAGAGVQKFNSLEEQLIYLIKSYGSEAERHRISSRIKAGIANSIKGGTKWGAPVGNDRAKGRRKDYRKTEPQIFKMIERLRTNGLSTPAIADFVTQSGHSISQRKVHRICTRCL